MPQPTTVTNTNITLLNSTVLDGFKIKPFKDVTRGTRKDVIMVDKDGLVNSTFDLGTSITDLQAQITNLENMNAETSIKGDGINPAIPTANITNWKANQVYNFTVQNNTANITLEDGTVIGTATDPIEKGATLQIVKISTGYGYLLRDSTDKSQGTCILSNPITLAVNTPFVYNHGLNELYPSSIVVYDSVGQVITNETNLATVASGANTVTVTSSIALTGIRIKVCTGILGATFSTPATTNSLTYNPTNKFLSTTVNGVITTNPVYLSDQKVKTYTNSINNSPTYDRVNIVTSSTTILPTHCKINNIPAMPNGGRVVVFMDFDVVESAGGTDQFGVVTSYGQTQNYYASIARSVTIRPQVRLNGVVVVDYAQPKQVPDTQNIVQGTFDIPAGTTVNVIDLQLVIGYNVGYTVGVDNYFGIFDSTIMVTAYEYLMPQ